jgi:AraC family transcriptional regulator of adaptative response/methylated-DNA-[protein]-cysteine methyltransferase
MNQAALDYQRIERAIAFLDGNWTDQPDLASVARHVGLSPAHFERMFVRWAGVSPMQFLRFLTKENAKLRLRAGRSVLDTALDVGLSGPGRLHDLLVTSEAVTPGEYRRGGAGTTITHGFAPTPFGECLIATTPRGICALEFVQEESKDAILRRLVDEWPRAKFAASPGEARRLAQEIFGHPGSRLRLHLRGTNFQLKVWQALLTVAPGELATYQDIARAIGQPTASRAVGSAVGANPVSFLIRHASSHSAAGRAPGRSERSLQTAGKRVGSHVQ